MLSLKVVHLLIACQSEHSLRYFHLGRISDFFSIHRSSSHTLLAAEKRYRVAVVRKQLLGEKLRIRPLQKYRFFSKIKLHPPIEIGWSLNFRASTPIWYVTTWYVIIYLFIYFYLVFGMYFFTLLLKYDILSSLSVLFELSQL